MMTSFSILIVLIALAQLTFAQVPGFGQCPSVRVMQNFDAQRYTGLWYEVKKYPFIFTIGGKCITANYELNPDGTVQVYNRQFRNNQENSIVGKARIIHPGVGILGVSFPNVPFQREANYNVLYTDYNTFAVVYSCSSFFGLVNAKSVWILSRSRFPTQYVYTKANEVLRENNISTHFLSQTDNDHCPDDEHIKFNTIDSFRD